VHEIKLDGYWMARGSMATVRDCSSESGLDWTARYPSAIAAIENLKVKTA
jgi:ATP-dependent DNA ligase